MLNLIKKLAITQLSNASNSLELDNVMSGVDGASTFGYSLTPTAVQVNDNQRQQYKFTHQLDIRTLDPSSADRAKLAAIESESSTVDVAGLTLDGWLYLRGKLTRSDQYDEIIADRFLLTTDTPAGYNAFYIAGKNLLAGQDILNPVSFVGSDITGTASGKNLTLTRTGGYQIISLSPTLYTPFIGEVITLSVNISAVTTTSGNAQIALDFRDSAGSIVVFQTVNITGTGIVSLTATIPAGTVRIEPYIYPGDGIGDLITYSEPMLARGSNTQFSL